MSLNDICTADNTRQNKGQEWVFFSFFLFFLNSRTPRRNVCYCSLKTGFTGDLKVLFQKLLIDH